MTSLLRQQNGAGHAATSYLPTGSSLTGNYNANGNNNNMSTRTEPCNQNSGTTCGIFPESGNRKSTGLQQPEPECRSVVDTTEIDRLRPAFQPYQRTTRYVPAENPAATAAAIFAADQASTASRFTEMPADYADWFDTIRRRQRQMMTSYPYHAAAAAAAFAAASMQAPAGGGAAGVSAGYGQHQPGFEPCLSGRKYCRGGSTPEGVESGSVGGSSTSSGSLQDDLQGQHQYLYHLPPAHHQYQQQRTAEFPSCNYHWMNVIGKHCVFLCASHKIFILTSP